MAKLSFRNKGGIDFLEQTKAEEIHHHRIRFIGNIKGSSLSGNKTTLIHIIKTLKGSWDTQVAQSVKRPTLDFGSAHDLSHEIKFTSGSTLGMEPA